ncbi:unnamed protein product [Malus baccata var. baccata]
MAKEYTKKETPGHHLPKMTKDKPSGPYRALCTCLSIFLLLAGVTALTLWLVYRPHKPQFTIVGAAVYSLNVTSPPLISTTMQFTLVTRNPNRRVSIYYDRLSAFVAYKNQAITPQLEWLVMNVEAPDSNLQNTSTHSGLFAAINKLNYAAA